MLKRLFIQDFAIISSLEVEFHQGLNILTGETGAGKSILLGAIGLLIGERAFTEMIRTGKKRAIVEGEFLPVRPEKLDPVFESQQIEFSGDVLIIRREINENGQNRIFINDQLSTLQTLKQIGDILVDFYGQHEHQSLLDPDRQKQFLDEYGNHGELLSELAHHFQAYRHIRNKLQSLKEKKDRILEERNIAELKLRDISAINPVTDEDVHLDQELAVLENAEFLMQTAGEIAHSIDGDHEQTLYDQLNDIRKKVTEIANIDETVEAYQKEIESALISIKELGQFFNHYSEQVNLDPSRLSEVRIRIDQLNQLKKKYGPKLKDVLTERSQLEAELRSELNVDAQISQLEQELSTATNNLQLLSDNLHHKRLDAAGKLKNQIQEHLRQLGMQGAIFDIRFYVRDVEDSPVKQKNHPIRLNADGYDFIEFFLSANAGDQPKPLNKVASGGEISRIMLAIKSSTATTAGTDVLVFDEIDTGVSGRIAFAIGSILSKLAENHQVFVITHLAQVSSRAGWHFRVSKSVLEGKTESTVERLSDSERVEEIARLLSGENLTDASRRQAEELLSQ